MTEVILETLKNYGICSANSHISEGLRMLAGRGKDRCLLSRTWTSTPHHVTLDYPLNQGLPAAPAGTECGLDDLLAASLGQFMQEWNVKTFSFKVLEIVYGKFP